MYIGYVPTPNYYSSRFCRMRNKLKLNKSPIKVIDEIIIENIREITSFSFQLTSLRYAELAYEITDMCTDGINFSSIAKMDEITEKVQYAMKDRKSTRLNSSHIPLSRMPSSA